MQAPTPSYIARTEATLSLDCARCRELRQLPHLVERLIAAGKGETPVDQLRFRCRRCGEVGRPYVTGPGNALIGRAHLWPPPAGTDHAPDVGEMGRDRLFPLDDI